MLTDPESFDLGELAAAADVTPRTIRYYVQQGLLPSPGTRGPGVRYDRAHLDRLQLIRRLQRQHLPLAEIRRQLEGLDDASVRDALASTPDGPRHSAALDYIRGVLASEPAPPGPVWRASARPAEHRLSAVRSSPARHLQAPEPPKRSTRSTRSTWDRIPLASDVELHVRRPLSREHNKLVDRLVEAARQLFAEEP